MPVPAAVQQTFISCGMGTTGYIMKKQNFIEYAGNALILMIVSMYLVSALAMFGDVQRCGVIADLIMLLAGTIFGLATVQKFIHWLFPKSKMSKMLNWVSWDAQSDAMFSVAQNGFRRIRKTHRASFPRHLSQCGAISRNLQHAVPMTRRPHHGRQHGGVSQATRQASGTKSSSSDEGEGEPPRLPALFPLLPVLFTYIQFSLLIGCSVKTLRNKVSAGVFPPPLQTQFGPRFTQSHLAIVLTPQHPPADNPLPTQQKRGRPRIAQGKGGAA